LLKDATSAISKFDDEQKKIDDERKKAEEEKKKASEAKARADNEANARAAAPALAVGPFDGRWGAKAMMSCVPRGPRYFGGVTVSAGQFFFWFEHNGTRKTCSYPVNPNGVFENKDCDVPGRGKFEGNKMQFHFKALGEDCDASAERR
jgi:hypothetical protein